MQHNIAWHFSPTGRSRDSCSTGSCLSTRKEAKLVGTTLLGCVWTNQQLLLCDITLGNSKQDGQKKEFKETPMQESHTSIQDTQTPQENRSSRQTQPGRQINLLQWCFSGQNFSENPLLIIFSVHVETRHKSHLIRLWSHLILTSM